MITFMSMQTLHNRIYCEFTFLSEFIVEPRTLGNDPTMRFWSSRFRELSQYFLLINISHIPFLITLHENGSYQI